jgi:hypothetical protein
MSQEVSAFMWWEGFEELGDGGLDLLEAPGVCLSQGCLELGEHLFDRVQVGTIGRRVEQLGTSRSDCSPYGRGLVAAQIVYHHEVAWLQGWDQELHCDSACKFGSDLLLVVRA